MGMYTELVLGCSIKNVPSVITAIHWLLDSGKNKTNRPSILPQGERIDWMFNSGGSYYFGANSGEYKFEYDNISDCYRFNARFNIKNYDNEIQKFLDWLKPYIEQGSGSREWYAAVTYEEDDEPTIYYLHEKHDN